MEYEYTWRNKWLTEGAKTLDDMIEILRSAATCLARMRGQGIVLRDDGCQKDDYATLTTTDSKVAKEFGFLPPLELEDENADDADDFTLEGAGVVNTDSPDLVEGLREQCSGNYLESRSNISETDPGRCDRSGRQERGSQARVEVVTE